MADGFSILQSIEEERKKKKQNQGVTDFSAGIKSNSQADELFNAALSYKPIKEIPKSTVPSKAASQQEKQKKDEGLFSTIKEGIGSTVKKIGDFISPKPVVPDVQKPIDKPLTPDISKIQINPQAKEKLTKSYLQFPSFVDNPDHVQDPSAAITAQATKASLQFWSAPIDNTLKATNDFLTYHPQVLDVLAKAQDAVENTPIVGLNKNPAFQGYAKGASMQYLGSSNQVRETFDKRLNKPTSFGGRAFYTVGEAIGAVHAFIAGGEVLKGIGLGKAVLPVLFATLGQTSAPLSTTMTQRIAKAPVDVVAGYLLSFIPASSGFSAEALKSFGKTAGVFGGQTFIDSLIEGQKPEEAAKAGATALLTAALFHIAGSSVNFLSESILQSKTKAGEGIFTPNDIRDVISRNNIGETKFGQNLVQVAADAEKANKNVKLNIEALQKSFLSDKLNLNKPEGININAVLVDKSAQLPAGDQGQGKTPVPPAKGSIEQIIESKEGWKPGTRVIFDEAMNNGDAATVKKMLPDVPKEYVQRFAENITKLIGTTDVPLNTTPIATEGVIKSDTSTSQSDIKTIPQVEKAKDYTSADDFATEVFSAQPDNQIGTINADDVTIRDSVGTGTSEYESLKKDIQNNGIQEPVRVTVEKGKIITTDGSQRTAIAKELSLPVPVIVNKGSIEGLKTIAQVYDEARGSEPQSTTPPLSPTETPPTSQPQKTTPPPIGEGLDTVRTLISDGNDQQARTIFERIAGDKPTFEALQQEVEDIQYSAFDSAQAQIKQIQDDLKGSDDPDGVIRNIAEKIAIHFNAPLAKRKITGARRTYTIQDNFGNKKSIVVGGTANEALDRLFYQTDVEGFRTAMEIMASKFDKSFTEIYSRIKSGDIDQADYENFKDEFKTQIEASRPPRPSKSDASGTKEGKKPQVSDQTPSPSPQSQTSSTSLNKDYFLADNPENQKRKDEVKPAGSPEELKKRIEQLNKFAQANAILRKTGGIKKQNAVGQFVQPSKNSDVAKEGLIKMKGKYIANDGEYMSVLAHETGHAIEYTITGATHKDMYKIFSDSIDAETKKTIHDELVAVTKELVGQDTIEKNPSYYAIDSELFARFIEKMMVSPANLEEIAPTATKLFEQQSINHPLIREFLEAAHGEIDKGVGKFKPLRDLRETYQKYLGKRVGNIVYDEEVVHRAMQERAKFVIEKFVKKKFKGVKDDPALLFRTAESIKITEGGEPVFGTRDFAKPKNTAEEKELEEAGWKKVDTQIEEGVAVPVYARQRYTQEEGKALYKQLSPEGKKLIQDFTAARDEAKDYFNREIIKDVNKVEGNIEGWVHRYFDESPQTGFNKGLKFKEKKAGTRKFRSGAEGYVEDFQKSMTKVLVDLEGEKVFNDFITRQFARVTKVIPDGQKPDAGWVEVVGSIKKGVGTAQEKRVVVIKDGKSFIPKQPKYQMPQAIYERYKLWRGLVDEASTAVRVVNDINRYWRINVLAHPGTAATNLISGGLQYSTKILTEFYTETLTGNIGYKQTRRNVSALVKALLPKGWADAPDWVYGGDQSNFYGQFTKQKSIFGKSIDAYGNGALKLFSAYERYWKKVISLSEDVRSLKELNTMDKEGLRLPTKDERDIISQLNEEIDLYAYDYDNIPLWLEAHKKGAAGQAIKPFATYPYKYAKHVMNLAGAAFDNSIPWQVRVAKLLTLTSLVAAYTYFADKRKQKQKTPAGTADTPTRLSPRGRLYLGEKQGKELFVRVAKYPFLNLSEGAMQLVNKNYEDAAGLLSDQIGSIGPMGKLALLAMGYRSKFEQYDSVPVVIGNTVNSYLPGYRILNDVSRMLDPFQRKQETFLQTLTNLIPTTDSALQQKLHGSVRTEKIPIEGDIKNPQEGSKKTTVEKELRNYWDDILVGTLAGLYINRIDPKDAAAFLIRGEKNKQKKDDITTFNQYVNEYMKGSPSISRKYEIRDKMVKDLLSDFEGSRKDKDKKKTSLLKKFQNATK